MKVSLVFLNSIILYYTWERPLETQSPTGLEELDEDSVQTLQSI